MALNWDVSNVKDKDRVTTLLDDNGEPILLDVWGNESPEGEKQWAVATQSLVWLSLACGFRTITKENWVEVYRRVSLYEKVNGTIMRVSGEPYNVTASDVHDHIGLSTNASPKTTTVFNKQILQDIEDAAKQACAAVEDYATA